MEAVVKARYDGVAESYAVKGCDLTDLRIEVGLMVKNLVRRDRMVYGIVYKGQEAE